MKAKGFSIVVVILLACFILPVSVSSAGAGGEPTSTPASAIHDIFAQAITDSSAKAYWTSDVPVKGWVEYGLQAGNYSEIAIADKLPRMWGCVNLSGLKKNTTYHYRVCTIDLFGKLQRSKDKSFTTLQASPASGRTYYVSTTGNDANDGLSKQKAWASVSHAADNVKAGDTVLIAYGDYKETKAIIIAASGTDTKPITFQGYLPADKSPIRKEGDRPGIIAAGSARHFITISGSHINLQGLKIVGSAPKTYIAMFLNKSNHVSVRDCELTSKFVGIYVEGCSYTTIDNCHVHHTGWNSVMLAAHNPKGPDSHHIAVTNCKVHDSGHGIIDVTVHFGKKFSHHHVDVLNNDLRESGVFYHWDEQPVIRAFNVGFNLIHDGLYWGTKTNALADSFIHNNKFRRIRQITIEGNKKADNVLILKNDSDGTPAGRSVDIRNGDNVVMEGNNLSKLFCLLGKTFTIRNHNAKKFSIVTDGTVKIEYTDGRKFSVDGKGKYATYDLAVKGVHVIVVSGVAAVGTISGTVKDVSGKPLAGVVVSDGARHDVTDATGAYMIADCPAVSCRLTATRPGYQNRTTDVQVKQGQKINADFGEFKLGKQVPKTIKKAIEKKVREF